MLKLTPIVPTVLATPVIRIIANIGTSAVEPATSVKYNLALGSSYDPEEIVLFSPLPADHTGAGRDTPLSVHHAAFRACACRDYVNVQNLATAAVSGATATAATATTTHIGLSEPCNVFSEPDSAGAIASSLFFGFRTDLPEII